MSVFADYIQTLGVDDAWAVDAASGSLAPLTGGQGYSWEREPFTSNEIERVEERIKH